MTVPKLSVILPNYNHAPYLPRCIEAILDQSYTDLELIIIDDASTDDSRDVIAEYARHDPRVRFHVNEKNSGVIATLNRALGMARGEYVFGAASDDYVLPGYFEKAMALFAAHPEAGITVGLVECVDDDGRLRFLSPGPWADEACYLPPKELAPRMTLCGVPGPVIWRKDEFLAAGGYHADLQWHGDWFPLQVVAFRRGVCFLPERVSVVREVPESYSQSQKRKKTQQVVLRTLMARIAAPEYRDVLWGYTASGIFRQFGPELIRAAALTPDLPAELLPPLRDAAFAHAANLMREPDAAVRAGLATLLGRYGREAFGLYDVVSARGEPDPGAAEVRRAAQAAILRDLPALSRVKFHVRSAAAKVLRAADRCARPLLHRRVERLERLLAEMLEFQRNEQYQALSALYQQLDRVQDAIRETHARPAEDARPRRAA
ncbi:glycosyltransferase family A protein [Urbifossiella limnaea]|uniref:Chondroitin synthase n=1 Tax=Urbifossiella limnaea TaxID=2528023 RepID=A0A517XZM0_9BACT|nr:glycosyltransferase family A protein [Urbifossiella limnaea]QDU22957.1 Chondroitin synthase [Urbifossiella limnaea]